MSGVALALIHRDGRWFLQRRPASQRVLPNRWEFPGGKLEPGESPQEALEREVMEELGVRVRASQALPAVEGSPTLHPFRVVVEPEPHTGLPWGWFTPEEILRLPIPPRNAALVRLLDGPLGGADGASGAT